MKFSALKTHQLSFDGLRTSTFIKGREYEVPDEQFGLLQQHGIAPSDTTKAAHPATENKMAHPVTQNKNQQHAGKRR